MTTEAETTQRRLSETVRDMLNEYRLQAHAGPVGDKALEEILFRAAHGVVQSLATYSGPQRVALLPHVVHMLLATFLEEIAATDQAHLSRRPPGGGPMIAALYARKSTESNVSAEAKSVVLQQDVARAFAVRHGWTVAD